MSRRFVVSVRTLYIVNAAWGFCFFVTFMLQCVPISENWIRSPEIADRHCMKQFDIFILTYAVTQIILDAAVLVLPWSEILGLNMPRSQKFAVLGIFGLGAM
jgi:hypothetical protein